MIVGACSLGCSCRCVHVGACVLVHASLCVHFVSGVLMIECWSVFFPVSWCIRVDACILPCVCM